MLPPLPLDVTHRIIRSSLPVVSYSTYKERYRLLLVFSLVHRTWLPLAQAELLKELFLRTSSETWEAHGYRGRDVQGQRYHLGETTKSKKDKPDARLRSLWTLKVKEVTLSNMNFQVEDLAALAGVEQLHLVYCTSPPPPPRSPIIPILTRLTTLSLVEIDHPFASGHWLNAHILPSLRHLSILFWDCISSSEDDAGVNSLLPQLHSLATSINDDGGMESTLEWTTLTSLRQLTLYPFGEEPGESIDRVLKYVPSGLSILKFGFISTDGHSILAPFVDPPRFGSRLGWKFASMNYESDLRWDGHVYCSLIRAFQDGYPSIRDVKEVLIEGGLRLPEPKNGEEPMHEVPMLEGLARAEGWKLERRIGWEGSEKQPDWERHLRPWP